MFHVKRSPESAAPARTPTSLVPALLLALAAALASGLLYPGENGYSLTRHYFSDLGMTVTYGGEKNAAGALFFLVTCGAFGYSVWRFARAVFETNRRHRWGASAGEEVTGNVAAAGDTAADHRVGARRTGAAVWLGTAGVLLGGFLAAIFFLLTGLTPKNLLFDLHNWVSYSAFLALLLLWVSGAPLAPSGRLRLLHVVMVLLSAGYLAVLFSMPSWEMPEGWALQVVAQKVVVIGNWLGMLTGAILLRSTIVSRET